MVDQSDLNKPNRTAYVRETERTSGGNLAFIVGGLVVLVAILAYFVFGDRVMPAASTGGNITIENTAPAPATPAPDAAAPMVQPPAAEAPAVQPPADAAPAEPAPAGNGAAPAAP